MGYNLKNQGYLRTVQCSDESCGKFFESSEINYNSSVSGVSVVSFPLSYEFPSIIAISTLNKLYIQSCNNTNCSISMTTTENFSAQIESSTLMGVVNPSTFTATFIFQIYSQILFNCNIYLLHCINNDCSRNTVQNIDSNNFRSVPTKIKIHPVYQLPIIAYIDFSDPTTINIIQCLTSMCNAIADYSIYDSQDHIDLFDITFGPNNNLYYVKWYNSFQILFGHCLNGNCDIVNRYKLTGPNITLSNIEYQYPFSTFISNTSYYSVKVCNTYIESFEPHSGKNTLCLFSIYSFF